MRPLLVVTGRLVSIRSEGTGNWGGTCGSFGDDNCEQGTALVQAACWCLF